MVRPYRERRAVLEDLFAREGLGAPFTLCPNTTDRATAQDWLDPAWGGVGIEGVVRWAGLAEREESTGIRPGDSILLSPDYRVDELLSLYTRSSPFRGYTRETKRNYITDVCLFLNFLWLRGRVWTQLRTAIGRRASPGR